MDNKNKKIPLDKLLEMSEEELEAYKKGEFENDVEFENLGISEIPSKKITNHKKETDLIKELNLDSLQDNDSQNEIILGKPSASKNEPVKDDLRGFEELNTNTTLPMEEQIERDFKDLREPFKEVLDKDELEVTNKDSDTIVNENPPHIKDTLEVHKLSENESTVKLNNESEKASHIESDVPDLKTQQSSPPPIQTTPPIKDKWFTKKSVTLLCSTVIVFSGLLAIVSLGNNDSDAEIQAEKYSISSKNKDIQNKEELLKSNQEKLKQDKDELMKKESKLMKQTKALEKEKESVLAEKNKVKKENQTKTTQNEKLNKEYFKILSGSNGLVSSVNNVNSNFKALASNNSSLSSADWQNSVKTATANIATTLTNLKSLSDDIVSINHVGSFSSLQSSISYLESSVEAINQGINSNDLYSMSNGNSDLVMGAIYLDIALKTYDSEVKELGKSSNLAELKLDTTLYFTDATIVESTINQSSENTSYTDDTEDAYSSEPSYETEDTENEDSYVE